MSARRSTAGFAGIAIVVLLALAPGAQAQTCGATLCPGDNLNAAYQSAPTGVQTVFTLGAGDYGDQVIDDAPDKEAISGVGPHVVFEPAPGAIVTAGSFRLGSNVDANDGPDHLTVRGFKLREQLFVGGNDASDILVKGFDAPGFYVNGAQDVTLKDGDWGPAEAPGIPNSKVDGNPANRNIHIIGGSIHEVTFGPSCFPTGPVDCHGEGFFVVGAGPGFVIDGVRFWGNEIYNVFFQAYSGPNPDGCLIQNNWFGRTQNSDGQKRGTSLTFGTNFPPKDCIIRFNSFAPDERLVDENGATFANTRVVGNRMGGPANCIVGMTYSFNVWTSGGCSANDRSESTFNYVNPSDLGDGDYHLTGGVAVDLVSSASDCVGNDFDGQARSTPCDAGSDEFGASLPPPLPPPVDPDRVVFCDEFVPNERASWQPGKVLAKWASQNPSERDAWSTFADAICAGGSPTPPTLASLHGKALVAAGRIAL